MSVTVPQQEEKFLVRNNTAGFIGVVEVDFRGEERGVNIDPHGARWMTEREMLATARAPRDPHDNPFEETTLLAVDPETQRRVEIKVRPLTLERDASRFVPSNERYVPTQDAPEEAGPASRHEAAAPLAPAAAPPSSGSSPANPPLPPTPTAQGAPGPAMGHVNVGSGVATGQADAQSWVADPVAPGQIIDGSLNGSDEGAPAAPDEDVSGPRFVPTAGQAQAAPQTPGQVAEEHAEVDPAVGEETGAAKPPTQPRPEGEYAQAEEVGSPDAPASDDDDSTLIGG